MGVSARHLQRLVKRFKATGVVPTLKTNRRPKSPLLTADQKIGIEAARNATQRGATKLYRQLLREGIKIPKAKIHAYCRTKGWTTPNPRKQKKRSLCRYATISLQEAKRGGKSPEYSDRHPSPYVQAYQGQGTAPRAKEFRGRRTRHSA